MTARYRLRLAVKSLDYIGETETGSIAPGESARNISAWLIQFWDFYRKTR